MESDLDGPKLENTLRQHKASINSAVFSPDSNQIVSGSHDGNLIFWNLEGSKPSETGVCYKLYGHKDSVNCVDFAPNGRFFCSSSKDTTVRLWRLSSTGAYNNISSNNISSKTSKKPNEESIVYKCHGLNTRYVNINPESTHFCTASDDKTVKLWDANHRNKFITSLLGHNNWVRCCKYSSKNPDLVASVGDDALLLVHDIRSGPRSSAIHTISGSKSSTSPSFKPCISTTGHFTSCDWYPLSDFLIAVGSNDSSIRLYDLRQGRMVQFYESHTGSISSLSFHPSGKYLMSGSFDTLLKIYDLMEGRVLYTIQVHNGPVNCVSFNKPNGHQFLSVGNDRTVYVWNSNLASDDNSKHQDVMSTFTYDHQTITPTVVDSPSPPVPSKHPRLTQAGPRVTFSNSSTQGKLDQLVTNGLSKSKSDTWKSSKTFLASGDSHDDMRTRKKAVPSKNRVITIDDSDLDDNGDHHNHDDYISGPPEQRLLRGIVDQISNLTHAVSLIERRLTAVEDMVEHMASHPVADVHSSKRSEP